MTDAPSEKSIETDALTGVPVTRWTSAKCKNQHLYFTSPSVTADDRWLTILSDRTGSPNLYAIDRPSGAIRQLSRNDQGLLRSYVYPLGGLRGISKASPCLDAVRNRLYYVQDDAVHAAHLDAPAPACIAELPPQWFGGFSHVSPDGKTFCIPVTDPRAFVDPSKSQWDQMRAVPKRMKSEKLTTRIYFVDVDTGVATIHAEVPFWVTHVQFDPLGTGRIVFNQEGTLPRTGLPEDDRIWCLETDGSFHPLAPQPAGEWRSHENWAVDGSSIVYHGGDESRAFLAARRWDGTLLYETSLAGLAFYHATGALDGRRLFVDRKDGVISLIDPFTTPATVIDICRHDTTIDDQDAHAHPLTTPPGTSLTFTSIRSGHCQVYEAPIAPAAR